MGDLSFLVTVILLKRFVEDPRVWKKEDEVYSFGHFYFTIVKG